MRDWWSSWDVIYILLFRTCNTVTELQLLLWNRLQYILITHVQFVQYYPAQLAHISWQFRTARLANCDGISVLIGESEKWRATAIVNGQRWSNKQWLSTATQPVVEQVPASVCIAYFLFPKCAETPHIMYSKNVNNVQLQLQLQVQLQLPFFDFPSCLSWNVFGQTTIHMPRDF